MLALHEVAIFCQTAGTFLREKNKGAHNFSLLWISPEWRIFFFQVLRFGAKIFWHKQIFTTGPNLCMKICFLSTDCTAFFVFFNLNTRLPTLVFLYDWSLFSVGLLFIIDGGLVLVYNFWFSRPRIMRVVHVPSCRALSSPMRRTKWCNGHGSWVMGHVDHGPSLRWVTWVMDHKRWSTSISALRGTGVQQVYSLIETNALTTRPTSCKPTPSCK